MAREGAVAAVPGFRRRPEAPGHQRRGITIKVLPRGRLAPPERVHRPRVRVRKNTVVFTGCGRGGVVHQDILISLRCNIAAFPQCPVHAVHVLRQALAEHDADHLQPVLV